MATLKLEILRHGPPQNHLLSPLTEYLALCADQPASTVRIPFEHADLLDRLRTLAYAEDAPADRREQRIRNLSEKVGEVLGQVPGLIAECSRHPINKGDILHLRLVLSAHELALVPFELALSPPGFPGAGDHLCLQSASPLCLTREVRRAAPVDVAWPSKSKILFAAAAPPGVPPVPVEAHLLALLRALDAWIHAPTSSEHSSEYSPGTTAGTRADVTREHIKVLPAATLRQISDECRSGAYTHVHILAHGVPYRSGDDRRFGIALHDEHDPRIQDIVDGARLGAALRTHKRDGDRELARPAIVTLCSCDSGNVGRGVGAGASIAHELHASGIPLVIASQFPLSIEGSIHLTGVLYRALLRGDDPRVVLDDARRHLRAVVRDRHDWASLVAYATFPSDLAKQLRTTRREQAERAIHAALTHLDAVARTMPKRGAKAFGVDAQAFTQRIESADARVREPLATLDHLRQASPHDTDILGLLGSVKKRLGEVYYRGSSSTSESSVQAQKWRENAETHLRQAHRFYGDLFETDRTASWALVQKLVLALVIGRDVELEEFQLAYLLATRDEGRHDDRGLWARRSLMELSLIEPLCSFPKFMPPARDDPMHFLRAMLTRTPSESELASLRGQLERFRDFFLDKICAEAQESALIDPHADARFQRIKHESTGLEVRIHRLLRELAAFEGRQGA